MSFGIIVISLHPGKLTRQWKTNHLKMYLLFKIVIFQPAMLVFGGISPFEQLAAPFTSSPAPPFQTRRANIPSGIPNMLVFWGVHICFRILSFRKNFWSSNETPLLQASNPVQFQEGPPEVWCEVLGAGDMKNQRMETQAMKKHWLFRVYRGFWYLVMCGLFHKSLFSFGRDTWRMGPHLG